MSNNTLIKNKYIILSLDVVTSGPFISKNGILSIAASVQTNDSEEIMYFQSNLILPDGFGYNNYYLRNLLKKENENLYSFIIKDPKPAKDVMIKFWEFIQELNKGTNTDIGNFLKNTFF